MSSTTSPYSTPSPHKKKPKIELDNAQLDCPNIKCGGWLRFFANEGSKEPVFVCCSNDFEDESGNKHCLQKVMLSKFDSNCPCCSLSIRKKEVITCAVSGGRWIHVKCFRKLKVNEDGEEDEPQERQLFAICQRCRGPLYEEDNNSQPSVCAGIQGFRHLKCPNKRKVGHSYDGEDPSSPSSASSSQEA